MFYVVCVWVGACVCVKGVDGRLGCLGQGQGTCRDRLVVFAFFFLLPNLF